MQRLKEVLKSNEEMLLVLVLVSVILIVLLLSCSALPTIFQ